MPSRFLADLGRTLDARPDRLDLRDREYLPLVASLPARWPTDAVLARWLPAYAGAGLVLDQGEEGACTGFGLASVVNCLQFRASAATRGRVESVSTRMLYHLARFYDEWAGEDYDGSSCRGALKAWHKHGVCRESLWPYRDARGRVVYVKPRPGWDTDALKRTIGVYYRINRASVVDMQAAIRQTGAIYCSATVHDGWDVSRPARPRKRSSAAFSHAQLPMIQPLRDRKSKGGHAFALVGYNERGFVVQNSWGETFGLRGFAVLPYAEWTRHGDDAWVCALGVPADLESRLRSPATFKPGAPRAIAVPGAAVTLAARPLLAPEGLPASLQPLSIEQAYPHTLVSGNDGRLINRLVTAENASDATAEIVTRRSGQWLRTQPAATRRICVYAHGGLNSEEDSLRRIRLLAPGFLANDIYPLFLTWKTGPLETLRSLIDDQLQRVPRPEGTWDRWRETASDALDRTIEALAGPVLRPIWSQMKQNAAAAAQPGHGTQQIAAGLAELTGRLPSVEIHLIGHSAGAIVLGHLLDELRALGARVAGCTLLAPACSAQFALEHYRPAFARGTLKPSTMDIHVLSAERELEDSVGPYRKSLLWLVSRALERNHKTPILGLQSLYSAAATEDAWHRDERESARDWLATWNRGGGRLHVLSAPQVGTGRLGKPIAATHGCFDNAADILGDVLVRQRSSALRQTLDWLEY